MLKGRSIYSEIRILHIIGLVFVILCHIIQWSHFTGITKSILSIIHNFVACGVPLFLFVGGVLCAKSDIKNWNSWIWKRGVRVLLPYYIILLPVLVVYIFQNEKLVSISQFLVLILNLQGLQNFFIINFDFYTAPQGLGHLWYVTIVFLGYLLILLIDKVMKYQKKRVTAAVLIFFVIWPVFCLVHITSIYLLIFVLGYLYEKNCNLSLKKQFCITTVLFIVSTLLRLLFRMQFDGTLFYDYVVAPYNKFFTAVWIFVTVLLLREYFPKAIDRIGDLPVVVFFDSIIYEMYLIHSITLAGRYSVFNLTNSDLIANGISLVLTVVLSIIVHSIVVKVSSKMIV